MRQQDESAAEDAPPTSFEMVATRLRQRAELVPEGDGVSIMGARISLYNVLQWAANQVEGLDGNQPPSGLPEPPLRAHKAGCGDALSVPVDRCACGGRDVVFNTRAQACDVSAAETLLKEKALSLAYDLIGNSFVIMKTGPQNGWEEKLVGTLNDSAKAIRELLALLSASPSAGEGSKT